MNHIADEKHHTYIMIEEEKKDELMIILLSFNAHFLITQIRNREDVRMYGIGYV
jgi:DNA-binding XRE family transcriptional regulator